MNISELSSIFLVHSSSPLFSTTEYGNNFHSLLSISHDPTSMIEYFGNNSFPIERIFKTNYEYKNDQNIIPIRSSDKLIPHRSHWNEYNAPIESPENKYLISGKYDQNEYDVSNKYQENESLIQNKYRENDYSASTSPNILGIYHFPQLDRGPLKEIDINSYSKLISKMIF